MLERARSGWKGPCWRRLRVSARGEVRAQAAACLREEELRVKTPREEDFLHLVEDEAHGVYCLLHTAVVEVADPDLVSGSKHVSLC